MSEKQPSNTLHPTLEAVIERVRTRSATTRANYLSRLIQMENDPESNRQRISCSNMAHAAAGALEDQQALLHKDKPHIGIVTAYNDMLSAHQPFEHFPKTLKAAIRTAGGTAQVAGGVPAMCDGVTQGRPGMELSLFSRDVIAMSTAVALSHNVFDGALCLGVCDKIIPGLVMGALAFGHLPVIMVPAGPMSSGLSNAQKAATRKAFAKGEIERADLLAAEASSYHGPGTCTFYGTANSNQMLMEVMGLHLPSAAFYHPHSDMRHALNLATGQQIVNINRKGNHNRAIGRMLDERSFVNAVVALHATGGSTNHSLHIPAMAAAAGIDIRWDDFAELSKVVPLLTRIYPNGQADVNHFHAAGGISFVIHQLLTAGLIDGSALSVWGDCLHDYSKEPYLNDKELEWRLGPTQTLDPDVVRPVNDPYQKTGGLVVLDGNIGRAVIKVSAVNAKHQYVKAPAAVFDNEQDVKTACQNGDLDKDVIIVVKNQGPQANGMPELHALTPLLSNIQDKGFAVALLTDGRMSGASGKVPAAIHLTPEAKAGGFIRHIKNGDIIVLDAAIGLLEIHADIEHRANSNASDEESNASALTGGYGRELFSTLRNQAASAEHGGGLKLLEQYK